MQTIISSYEISDKMLSRQFLTFRRLVRGWDYVLTRKKNEIYGVFSWREEDQSNL